MNKSSPTPSSPPISREDVMSDLGGVICATAHHLAIVGASDAFVSEFLGVEVKDARHGCLFSAHDIDLSRFTITPLVEHAYDFAFQTGEVRHRVGMDLEVYSQLTIFRRGAVRSHWDDYTAMSSDDSDICRTLDTAFARHTLDDHGFLDIRQLALLAQMTEPAVRTSLSAAGIKSDGGTSGLAREKALQWLEGRRRFIPTMVPDPLMPEFTSDFGRLLRSSGYEDAAKDLVYVEHSLFKIADICQVDPDWLLEVATGRATVVDLEMLQKLDSVFSDGGAAFVGRAVELAIRAQHKSRVDELNGSFPWLTASAAEKTKSDIRKAGDGAQEGAR
jgi:hypothetical protein